MSKELAILFLCVVLFSAGLHAVISFFRVILESKRAKSEEDSAKLKFWDTDGESHFQVPNNSLITTDQLSDSFLDYEVPTKKKTARAKKTSSAKNKAPKKAVVKSTKKPKPAKPAKKGK